MIVSTPTNYDENNNFFDTSSVEVVISEVIESEPTACVVVKSDTGWFYRGREEAFKD